MKIYLVRHGETDANKIHTLVGQKTNIDINENGVKQAKELKEKIKDIPFDICFTSPLTRTKSTAKIIVDNRTEIIEDSRIMERYLGELEGKDRELYDIEKYNDYELNTGENKVEKIRDLFTRCNDFINYLKETYPNSYSILVVSHYGCIRAMHHILSNSNTSEISHDLRIENCCFREYEV